MPKRTNGNIFDYLDKVEAFNKFSCEDSEEKHFLSFFENENSILSGLGDRADNQFFGEDCDNKSLYSGNIDFDYENKMNMALNPLVSNCEGTIADEIDLYSDISDFIDMKKSQDIINSKINCHQNETEFYDLIPS